MCSCVLPGIIITGLGKKKGDFRLSGSSALGTYLKVDVDTSKKTAKVYKGVNNTATPELIETISLEPPKGNITPPPPEAGLSSRQDVRRL